MTKATSPLVIAARELAGELPGHRAAHDANKHLAPPVVEALHATGVLGALVPRELGGAELAPADYIALLDAIAGGDAATAWCVMTASTSTLLAAYFARDTASTVWAATPPFLAGVFAPGGKLVASGDGFRLSGKWSWGSGSRHATWFAVGAIHERRHVVCLIPSSAVRIVENWDPLGLAGTGSHDLAVEDAQVATPYVTSVFDRAPWPAGALYRVPLFGLLATGIAACALGVARVALDHASRGLGPEPSSSTLGRYAGYRAELASARAYLVEAASLAHDRAAAGDVDVATRGELRLAASFATHRAAEVVRGAFHLGGGANVRTDTLVNRALRDVETMLTHRMVIDRTWPVAARAVLGIGTAPPDL